MGSNVSSGCNSSSPPRRAQSLPVAHNYHQNQQPRQYLQNSNVGRPPPAPPHSSRFRQALPNFVHQFSSALGQKLLPSQLSSRNRKISRGHAGNRHSNSVIISASNLQTLHTNQQQPCRKRSRSKTREHCRLFRELVTGWCLSDLHCLVVEFEAAAALKELTRRADRARCPASSVEEDFAKLFYLMNLNSDEDEEPLENKDDSSADAFLNFDKKTFAVHRAFLGRRCAFFRRLLSRTSNSINSTNLSDRKISRRPVISVTFPSTMSTSSTSFLNAKTFKLLLEYLYTGEISTRRRGETERVDDEMDEEENFRKKIFHFGNEGAANSGGKTIATLRDDVATMLKYGDDTDGDADAVLIFTSGAGAIHAVGTSVTESTSNETDEIASVPGTSNSNTGDDYKARCCKFKCHSVVLAARSPFFRSIIRKRRLQDEQVQRTPSPRPQYHGQTPACSSSSEMLEIVLDESVIPRQYAPVLLHALYTDEVDLSLVMRHCVSSAASCLTEVQAIAAGKCQLSPIDEATEIYQIARFLEFEKLAQGCEDAIVANLTSDTLAAIYNWSIESHGSEYVRRHCVDFLCQEFAGVCSSPLLYDIDETLLVEALKSDYVQATELEILHAVIRWGEHQLVRRIEEREPNILAGTTHSISRKGVKRTDLSDAELKEILIDLLPLVRTDYILPPHHAVLQNVIGRGLISVPPSELLSPSPSSQSSAAAGRRRRYTAHRHSPSPLKRSCSTSTPGCETSRVATPDVATAGDCHWSQPHRHSNGGSRLYFPYLEEARTLLEKRVAESPDQLSFLINHHPPVTTVSDSHFTQHTQRYPDALYMVDGGSGYNMGNEPFANADESAMSEVSVPPPETLRALKERVNRLLRSSATVKRALACGCSYHRNNVLKQIRLRAIREFGLPDTTISVLVNYGAFTASPSGYAFSLSSTSETVLQDDGRTRGLSRMDDGNLSNDYDVSTSCRASKRRFRSEPGLAQCDDSFCSSASMDWPDLMASSFASSVAPADQLSPSRQHRRNTSISTDGSWLNMGEKDENDFGGSAAASFSAAGNQAADEHTLQHQQHRQQIVDLTRQICDLVVHENVGHQQQQQQQEHANAGPDVRRSVTPDLHRDTMV